jgi:HPt (histidine-containing phosphotransfer) domain-containing protein
MPGESPDRTWTLPDSLRELTEGGTEDLLKELLAVFRADSTERFSLLRQALEAGERQEIRTQAHALKGSAAQVGADAMAKSCHDIEIFAPSGTPAKLSALLERAKSQFEEVCDAIVRVYGD